MSKINFKKINEDLLSFTEKYKVNFSENPLIFSENKYSIVRISTDGDEITFYLIDNEKYYENDDFYDSVLAEISLDFYDNTSADNFSNLLDEKFGKIIL